MQNNLPEIKMMQNALIIHMKEYEKVLKCFKSNIKFYFHSFNFIKI